MDINGQRYFLLREAEEFHHRSSRLLWQPSKRALTLAQNQQLRLPANDMTLALSTWENDQVQHALVQDKFGQQARIAGAQIHSNSGRGFVPLVDDYYKPVTADAGSFEDLAVGGDDKLAAVYSNQTDAHGVLLFHLRRRWASSAVLPERARRVWVDAYDTVWCMGASRVFACKGAPLPHGYKPAAHRFEP